MTWGFKIFDPMGNVVAESSDEGNTSLKDIRKIARTHLHKRDTPKGSYTEVFRRKKTNPVFDSAFDFF